MKWLEIEGVPEGTLLVHALSGRVASLIEKFRPPLRTISVRYLDGQVEERVDPKQFDRLKPPTGTVPRTN